MEGGIWGFESLSLYARGISSAAEHRVCKPECKGSSPLYSTPAIPLHKDVAATNGLRPTFCIFDEDPELNVVPQKKAVKQVSDARNVTVSPAGLAGFVLDSISFLPTTRTVEKVNENTGRYYQVSEDIPAEELFTLVAIRVGENGKFVVQVTDHDLDKLNTRKVRNEKVTEYETL